jgi:hypothetical protein
MTVREIIVDSLNGPQKHIIIERDDGSFMSFPADLENPNYANIMQLVAEGKLTIAPAE